MAHSDRIAISWAEILMALLLVLSGLSLQWALARGANFWGARNLPSITALEQRYELPTLRAEQRVLQQRLDMLLSKQMENRLEIARLEATLEAYVSLHPELTSQQRANVPAIVSDAYNAANMSLRAGNRYASSLDTEIARQRARLAAHARAIQIAENRVSVSSARSSTIMRLVQLFEAFAVLALVFVLGRRLARRLFANLQVQAQPGFAVGGATAALFVLFAHAAFGLPGAVIAAVVIPLLLIVPSALAARRVRWQKVSVRQ